MKPVVGIPTFPHWDMTCGMEEVGWSQAWVWRSDGDNFINDEIMLGVLDIYIFFEVHIMYIHDKIKDDSDLHSVASWL